MKYGIPDYRGDTGPRDAVRRVVPRVTITLLGLLLSFTGAVFAQPERAFWSTCIAGFVLAYLGVGGFWLPYVRVVQLGVAAWLVASVPLFGVSGPALWTTLGVAMALAVVSLLEGREAPGTGASSR